MKDGYDIAVEKIGHSSQEIYSIIDKYRKEAGNMGYTTTAQLYCAHVSRETSTVRAASRTMLQIRDDQPLRFYPDNQVFYKDNTSLYSYLEVLLDHKEGGKRVFSEMGLSIEEGLSMSEKYQEFLSFNQEKEERHLTNTTAQKQRQEDSREAVEGKSADSEEMQIQLG